MKCVCGYEYEVDWSNGQRKALSGDEEFITVDTKATIEYTGYHGGNHDVTVCACPKCGTLRIDRH